MSSTITAPEVVPETPDVEDEIVHLVCCNCNPDVALCGEDVSTFRWVGEDEQTTCPLCVLAEEAGGCCGRQAV